MTDEVLLGGLQPGTAEWLETRLDGVRIRAALTGDETLDALAEGGWTVAVLDAALESPPAYEVLRRARTHLELVDLSIVYCLGELGAGGVGELLLASAGADRLLQHPHELETLAVALEEILGRRERDADSLRDRFAVRGLPSELLEPTPERAPEPEPLPEPDPRPAAEHAPDQAEARPPTSPHPGSVTILVITADDEVERTLRDLLDPSGFELVAAADADSARDLARESRPHLILLDAELPDADALALCKVLDLDPALPDLQILIMIAEADAETIRDVLAAGADDFVHRRVVGPEILTRIANRLQVARRPVASRDALTGLLARSSGEPAIREALASADVTTATLGLIDLDRFELVNERAGPDAGDAVLERLGELLASRLDPGDVAVRWVGDEVLVLLRGTGHEGAVRRLSGLLDDLSDETFLSAAGLGFSVTFTAAVAEVEGTDADLPTLYARVRAAVRAAQGADGGDVVTVASP